LDLVMLLAMGVLPGAALAFPLGRSLELASRVAIAIVLSPLLVSIVFVGSLLLGVAPGSAAGVAGLTVLPGVWALFRVGRADPGSPAGPRIRPRELALICGALSLPLLWLVIHWLVHPQLLSFGFHNLLHVDMVYELVRPPLWPEEPEAAGLPLNYSWLVHGAWAAKGLLADRPPIAIYPVSNLLLLAGTLVLVERSAHALGLPRAASLLAAVLAVLGGHLLLEAARLAGASAEDQAALFGDARLASPVIKFALLDGMPVSIALFAGSLRLGVALQGAAALRAGAESLATDARVLGLLAFVLLAMALMYPLALPPTVGWLGSLAVLEHFWGTREGRARMRLLAGLALALTALALALGVLQQSTSNSLTGLASGTEALGKLRHVLLATAPLLLFAMPAGLAALRSRDTLLSALFLCALGNTLAYAVLSARFLEYKFVLYSRLPVAIVIAASYAALASRTRWAQPVAGAAVLTVAGLSLMGSLHREWPASWERAPQLDNRSFRMALGSEEPHAAWTNAVRENTPEDTVLVAHGPTLHVGTFANRALFGPAEFDGFASPGYGLGNIGNLVQFRAHPEQELRMRMRMLSAIYRGPSHQHFYRAIGVVRELGRPVAVWMPADETERLDWLLSIGGRLIHRDERSVLWWIDAQSPS
jgi:hypothetical protein